MTFRKGSICAVIRAKLDPLTGKPVLVVPWVGVGEPPPIIDIESDKPADTGPPEKEPEKPKPS